MKGLKTGGRKAGTPNKQSQELKEMAKELGIHPFRFLLLIVRGDLRDFGYHFEDDYKKETLSYDRKVGAMLPQHLIPLETRKEAARELLAYLYPKLKPAEDEEDSESSDAIHFVSKDEFNKAKDK